MVSRSYKKDETAGRMPESNNRIVITGVGLTSPIGNDLSEYRKNLLDGKSGIKPFKVRFLDDVVAGVCEFDEMKYQSKKDLKRGTRAASIGVYSANEALLDGKIDLSVCDKSRIGIYVGITEHGPVETEEEIFSIERFDYDPAYLSHYFNPKVIANNPAGEIALKLGITGPHYTIGAACAAGNIGLINGLQMLLLNEVDTAIAGGVSESIRTFTTFAAFRSEKALGHHADPEKASRPFDKDRNGLVLSEGGCLFVMERLDDALKRGAKIYAEVVGYAVNTDATDYVLPNWERQSECMKSALRKASLKPDDIDIINTHATATLLGDETESRSILDVFGNHPNVYITNTKSFIGHTMGAAGALELAGELPSFDDGLIHHTLNLDSLDPRILLTNIVRERPVNVPDITYILNNSFGMLGINSTVIVKKYQT